MPRRPPDASQLSPTEYARRMAIERRRLEDMKRRGAPIVDPDGPYLEADDAAHLLGITVGYLGTLCRQGKIAFLIKSVRHGIYPRKIRLIPKTEISRYLTAHLQLTAPRLLAPYRKPGKRHGHPA